jgi:hypothetical protein
MKNEFFILKKYIRQTLRETFVRKIIESAGDKCLNCGTPKEEGDDFCGECGANVSETCIAHTCNAHVPIDDNYCGECGAPQFREDPSAREDLQKWAKRKKVSQLRKKAWGDAGGLSKADDDALYDKVMNDYETALENRFLARISRDPKLEEFIKKHQEASKNFKKYIRDYATAGQKYLEAVVKLGVATDYEKSALDDMKKRYKQNSI